MFDFFQLEEELEGMFVGAATIFPSVVGKNCLDFYIVILKEGENKVVECLDRSDGILLVNRRPHA